MNEKDFEGSKINMSKEDAERWMKYIEAVNRLKQNPDFRLFFDVYTRSELLRSAYLLTDAHVESNKDKHQIQENLIENIKAASSLRNYIEVELPAMEQAVGNTLQAYREEENKPEAAVTEVVNNA